MSRLLSFLFFLSLGAANGQQIHRGKVIDKKSKEVLPYVTISAGENINTISDENGLFQLHINDSEEELTIQASFVGKKKTVLKLSSFELRSIPMLVIQMEDNDLYMDEITVTAERDDDNVSVSAFKLDRSTIEQAQASSLGDLLKLIPGQEITNPQYQGAQSINFRSSLSNTQQSLNNSFGIGLVINGTSVDNNSNMQGLSPTTAGSFRSFGGTSFGSNNYATGDTPGGGVDLRQVPVGNIEKVEVIQGVASAKYGDISDGAIIVETSAGKSPLNLNVRQAGGNSNVSLGKGFQINERQSFFLNLDYLHSNPDTRDRIKAYNRISTSLMWDQYFGTAKQIKNSFSFSFNTNLDDFKIDPDFGTEKRVYYKNTNFSFSDRLSLVLNSKLADDVRGSVGLSFGRSTSYLNQFVNPGVLPLTAATEPGINIGTYHPSSYWSERSIEGEPINVNFNLNFNKHAKSNKTSHSIGYGLSFKYNGNFGAGRIFDPTRPMRFAGAATNERPMDYPTISPELSQFGGYLEDRMSTKFFEKPLHVSAGIRADYQLDKLNWSPRLNAQYALKDNVRLTLAFGLAYKAPGLTHLYPGPQYEDFALVNYFNGNERESLYLVYTHLVPNDASGLKSMQSDTKELGINANFKGVNFSLTGFQKRVSDGFSISSKRVRLDLPDFEILEMRQGQKPLFSATGSYSPVLVTERKITNSSFNDNIGAELVINVKTIKSIRTSFQLNLSWYQSDFYNQDELTQIKPNWQETDEIWYGIYSHSEGRSGNSNGLFTLNHHLSRLGLVLTLRSQAYLTSYTRTYDDANQAIAYLDSDLIRHDIPESERNSPQFAAINQTPVEGEFFRQPDFVYFNFHMNLSKNLGKNVRFSFFANNFLNIRPEIINTEGIVSSTLNQSPYFGLELNFKYQ